MGAGRWSGITPWHRLFMELIADFDVSQLEQRQTEALTRNGLPLPS